MRGSATPLFAGSISAATLQVVNLVLIIAHVSVVGKNLVPSEDEALAPMTVCAPYPLAGALVASLPGQADPASALPIFVSYFARPLSSPLRILAY